ncbi:helix-turn-helix domain-containing protein [Corynebacterium sp. CNJ-954]|uniref:helix-turn-helix domain-containing protein n=1 Tax=Corynebacterium sp. CNJ-954 TaxID=1904962 RepID=UPI0009F83343|nr:helix-turn-helix domain-containing protein [Corynebacterium sp. CNJ-954]
MSDPKNYISIKSTAELLDVSPRTVIRWIDTGELTRYKIGGVVRIDRDELDRRMATN